MQISNCVDCNPDDDKEASFDISNFEHVDNLEFIKLENKDK